MKKLPDGRWIDEAPWSDDANLSALERSDMDAPNWVLVWRRFRRHKLGLVSGLFLLFNAESLRRFGPHPPIVKKNTAFGSRGPGRKRLKRSRRWRSG